MYNSGMNLRAWNSNSVALWTQAALNEALDNGMPVKILGMRWDPAKDEITFSERNNPTLNVVT